MRPHLPVIVDAVVLRPGAVPRHLRRVGVAVPLVRDTAPDGVANEGAQPLRVVIVTGRQCICGVSYLAYAVSRITNSMSFAGGSQCLLGITLIVHWKR